jgi:hypothetical protein
MEGKVAVESGVAQAESLVVLGDGASWITEIAAWHFPQVKRQLDLWHLLRRGHRPSWGKTWPRLLDPPPYWCILSGFWDELYGRLSRPLRPTHA